MPVNYFNGHTFNWKVGKGQRKHDEQKEKRFQMFESIKFVLIKDYQVFFRFKNEPYLPCSTKANENYTKTTYMSFEPKVITGVKPK